MTVGGPFEGRIFTHCGCCWGPFWSRVPAYYSCCWGPLWKQSTYNLLWCMVYELIMSFSPKMRKIYTRNTSVRLLSGPLRQVPRSPPLKHTTDKLIANLLNSTRCLEPQIWSSETTLLSASGRFPAVLQTFSVATTAGRGANKPTFIHTNPVVSAPTAITPGPSADTSTAATNFSTTTGGGLLVCRKDYCLDKNNVSRQVILFACAMSAASSWRMRSRLSSTNIVLHSWTKIL